MSGYIGPMLAERALAAGVDEILKKPVQSREIAAALARVLKRALDVPARSAALQERLRGDATSSPPWACLAGCATTVFNPATNEPLSRATRPTWVRPKT